MAGKVISRFQSGSGIHLISSTFYGTCNTDADELVKKVEINDEHVTELKLIPGMLLSVKFTNGNTATSPQLKIYAKGTIPTENNNLEDNPLKGAMSITPNILTWSAGNVLLFVYDNEQWISNYLSVSGGNLIGHTTITDHNFYLKSTDLTNNTVPTKINYGDSYLIFRDSNDKGLGFINPWFDTSGNQYLRFYAQRPESLTTSTGTITTAYNGFSLGITNSGSPIVSFSSTNSQNAWQSALEIGTADTSGNAGTATKLKTARSLYVNLGTAYNSSAPVTFDGSAAKALPVNGTLPIANGGTGKATTTLVNYVFASPTASVTAATAPSWRKLVAADIPNLNTSKLTAGTLGIARGGTGQTAVTTVTANTGSTFMVYKWGPVITVQLRGYTYTPDSGTIIYTLAEGNRPSQNISAIVVRDNYSNIARLWVGTDGKIQINDAGTTTAYPWYGSLTYIATN